MEVLLPKNRSEFWVARHEVWSRDASEERPWRVTYGRISKRATKKSMPDDLQISETRLRQALREISIFSANHTPGGFTQWFTDAIDTLNSGGKNLHGYHKDLAPDEYLSDQAQAILDACQRAWVFGGMGSWNDLLFDGDEKIEYERVSEQLFQALNQAIAAAANDSYYRLG